METELSNNQETSAAPAPKTILVGTPTLDGKIDAWYTNSLIDTIRVAQANNILVKPIFLAYESILPMARNELFKLAFDGKYDHLVFIDADMGWEPAAFFDTVLAPVPVAALPYPMKGNDNSNYNVNLLGDTLQTNELGFIKAYSAGTGFLKIDKQVVEALYNSNISLSFRDKELKKICEYTDAYNDFVGEDVTLCNKIRDLGFDIWVNPKSTCIHIGNRVHTGNYIEYINGLIEKAKQEPAKDANAVTLFE